MWSLLKDFFHYMIDCSLITKCIRIKCLHCHLVTENTFINFHLQIKQAKQSNCLLGRQQTEDFWWTFHSLGMITLWMHYISFDYFALQKTLIYKTFIIKKFVIEKITNYHNTLIHLRQISKGWYKTANLYHIYEYKFILLKFY